MVSEYLFSIGRFYNSNKLRAIYIVIFLSTQELYAQKQGQARIDSLLIELPKINLDTAKVHLLNEISYSYAGINPIEGIKYGKYGLALAEKIVWKKGIAACLNVLGSNYTRRSDYPKAVECYQKALKINKEISDKNGIARNTGNIGTVYNLQGNFTKALEYYLIAYKIFEDTGNKDKVAAVIGNIGVIYNRQNNLPKALEYYLKALQIAEARGDKSSHLHLLTNIGTVYYDSRNYAKALEYYTKALETANESGDLNGIALISGNIANVYLEQGNYPQALENYNKTLKMYAKIDDQSGIAKNSINIGDLYQRMATGKNVSDKDKKEWLQQSVFYYKKGADLSKSLGILNEYQNANLGLSETYTLKGEYGSALMSYKEHAKYKDSLFNEEKTKELTRRELEYEYEKKRDSLNLVNDKKEIQLQKEMQLQQLRYEYQKKQALAKTDKERQQLFYEETLKRQKIESDFKQQQAQIVSEQQRRASEAKFIQDRKDAMAAEELKRQKSLANLSLTGGALLLIIALTAGYAYRLKRRDNRIIDAERKRSEDLLLNILPEEVAEELKANGTSVAKHYDNVSVLFTDFVNFTQISESLTPQQLVEELHECFSGFDAIMANNGLEKIKTIGDAYMAVCGLPQANPDHAKNTVQAALEIRDFIQQRSKNENVFEIRIGVNSGPVVAGIVGVKKFAYDIWGDSVNIAARMESSGEAGKVNISHDTFTLVKDSYVCIHRGKINAKNKGEIDMYFVEKKYDI